MYAAAQTGADYTQVQSAFDASSYKVQELGGAAAVLDGCGGVDIVVQVSHLGLMFNQLSASATLGPFVVIPFASCVAAGCFDPSGSLVVTFWAV